MAYRNKNRHSIRNIPSSYLQKRKLLKHLFDGAAHLYSSGTKGTVSK